MSQLPILTSCNNCGECCRHGGVCIMRMYGTRGPNSRGMTFKGRCELLLDQADGTTLCQAFLNAPQSVRDFHIVGQCDFPQHRKEIDTLQQK
jgi:hypothetical protein